MSLHSSGRSPHIFGSQTPPTSHSILHTLEETQVQQLLLLKGPVACGWRQRRISSRGLERWQAESPATTRSAAVDIEGRRTHIVVHVPEPTTCVRNQASPRFPGQGDSGACH